MDLLTALKILIRRWPVVLAGLVLTLVGTLQVGSLVKPTYEAKGQVWLVGPGTGNHLLEFPPGLSDTANGLVVILQSPTTVHRFKAAGATASYTLENTDKTVIQVTANGANKNAAIRTARIVIDGLQKELDRQQVGFPVNQDIRIETLESPTATVKMGSRIRAMAAVGAIGLAATVAAGLATDAIIRQMREAKLRREEDEDAEGWAPSYARDGYQAAFEARPPAHTANGKPGSGPAPQPALTNGANGHNGRASVYRPAPARSGAGEGSSYRDLPPASSRSGEGRPQIDAGRSSSSRPSGDPRSSSPGAPARPPGDPRPSSSSRPPADTRPATATRPSGDPRTTSSSAPPSSRPAGDARSSAPARLPSGDPRAAAPPRGSGDRRPAPAAPPAGESGPRAERRQAPDERAPDVTRTQRP